MLLPEEDFQHILTARQPEQHWWTALAILLFNRICSTSIPWRKTTSWICFMEYIFKLISDLRITAPQDERINTIKLFIFGHQITKWVIQGASWTKPYESLCLPDARSVACDFTQICAFVTTCFCSNDACIAISWTNLWMKREIVSSNTIAALLPYESSKLNSFIRMFLRMIFGIKNFFYTLWDCGCCERRRAIRSEGLVSSATHPRKD